MTFNINTSFSSIITPADAGTSQFGPNGRTNEGFMRGLDGNHYVFVDGSGHDSYALCAETGNVTTVTQTRFLNDLANIGSPVIEVDTGFSLSAPSTSYFWIVAFQANGAEVDYLVGGILYKIVSDGTINAVGGLIMRTEASGPREGRYLSNGDSYYSTLTVGNKLLALGQVHSIVFDNGLVSVLELPLDEAVIYSDIIGSFSTLWTDVTVFDDHFFDFIDTNRINPGPACLVPIGDSDWGVMVNVDQAIYDYAHAHFGVNDTWDTLTGPAVLWWKQGNVNYTDVSASFDLSDAMKHLDGSSSANYYDNYCGPNSFKFNGDTYVVFGRSYTLPDDLEPIGTFARVKVYLWTGSSSSLALDQETSLFDPISDCGVPPVNRTACIPQFVQIGYDPQDFGLRYVWYGANSSLQFDYVFGGLGTIVPEPGFNATFSEFINSEFLDWQSQDGVGADFTSELQTYYMLSDDTMLWMSDGTVFTYIENQGRGPGGLGLFMQPQWDWSESSVSNKFARNVQVYLATPLELVSTRQNNIRGKGRALQLHFTSEQGKDFNLLGWAVWHGKNARP